MSSVAGNFSCYFPQSFSPAWIRKTFFDATHRITDIISLQIQNFTFFFPMESHTFVQIECSSNVTENYWHGCKNESYEKMEGDTPGIPFPAVICQKNVPVSFTNSMAAALPAGWKGAKACWTARPLFRVSHQLKTRDSNTKLVHGKRLCGAEPVYSAVGLACVVACLAFTQRQYLITKVFVFFFVLLI